MEAAGLLSLPNEILHHISKYLAEQDLVNLLYTCKYLHNAFNDDSVWRKFVPVNITRLKFKEPLVEPKFNSNDFTPLCNNLILCKMKNHLLNNWKQGNFHKCSSKTDYSYATGLFSIPKGKGQIIYEDRFIFLGRFTSDVHSDGIEVWDIDNKPYVHCFLPIQNEFYDNFFIVGSYLVVVECIRVNVFQITIPEKKFPLLYSFIITEAEVTWNGLAEHHGSCDDNCYSRTFRNVGKYLVSNKCGDQGNVLHVWDILNASKSVFITPFDGFQVLPIFNEGDDWILKQIQQSGNKQMCYLFNIQKGTFSDTVFKFERNAHHIIFYKSHVIIFDLDEETDAAGYSNSLCTVYEFQSSLEVKRRCFNNARKINGIHSTIVVNGTFVILCLNSFKIVDALTLEIVDEIQCDLDVEYITHQFNLFGSVFVVAAGGDNMLYVWDIQNKTKLSRSLEVGQGSHLYMSESLSKLVTFTKYSKTHVLHFW